MSPFSGRSTKAKLKYLGFRAGICLLAVVIYFTVWRPGRLAVAEYAVYPQVEYMQEYNDGFVAHFEAGSLHITYQYGDSSKKISYRPEFGFFFLVALLALIFVSNQKKHFILLAGLHLAASLLAYVFLMLGALGFQPGFILVDAVSGYLTPALSLAFVPLVIKGVIE